MMKLWHLGKGSVGPVVRIVVFTLALICVSELQVMAQSTTSDSYGAYRFFSQGSGRVMAMGGTFAATVDDATAIDYNPAGAAISKWHFDFGGTNNRVDDQAGPAQSANPYYYQTTSEAYSFIQYAAAARVGQLVFGLGLSTPYEYKYSSASGNADISLMSYSAMVAWRVSEVFGVGVSGHLENLKERFEQVGGGAAEANGTATSITAGALYRTRQGGVGAVYFQGHSVPLSKDQVQDTGNISSWLRDVNVPAATCVGGYLNLNDRFVLAVDVDRFEIPNNLIDASSGFQYISNINLEPGTQQVVHAGFEWSLVRDQHMSLMFRAGGYMEPARIHGGESRLHRTYGLQVQFGPAVLTVSFDQANQFNNTSQGFSLVLGAI